MAWEKRNGNRYYYRKRREGRRVNSEYVGTGEFAALLAKLDQYDRTEEQFRRNADNNERQRWMQLDREINQALDLCSDLTSIALLLAGYHTHKGQWRRERGRRQLDS